MDTAVPLFSENNQAPGGKPCVELKSHEHSKLFYSDRLQAATSA